MGDAFGACDEPLRPAAYDHEPARRGEPVAMLALGRLHDARGTAVDRVKAFGWYLRASALGQRAAYGPVVRLLPSLQEDERTRAEDGAAWHLAQLAGLAGSLGVAAAFWA